MLDRNIWTTHLRIEEALLGGASSKKDRSSHKGEAKCCLIQSSIRPFVAYILAEEAWLPFLFSHFVQQYRHSLAER
jgi:hypothetical protein